MANVFLTSAADSSSVKGRLELRYIRESAERDKYGVHSVTENPDAADLILFVERDRVTGERQETIRTHHLIQERPQSCFVVNPRYRGIPYLPGVYASIREKWYDRSRVRSGHYLEVRENQYFRDLGPPPEEGYLYCFRCKEWLLYAVAY